MTTDDRDFWHATTDWLEAGSDQTPPEAVDAVLLAIRTTRQERARPRPLRPIDMKLYARVAIAAAAVVAIAFAWINLGPSKSAVGGVAGPSAPPVPTPLPTATPSPSASPKLLIYATDLPGIPLQGGSRYLAADPFLARLSFVAPDGWAANIGGPYAVYAGPAATGNAVWFQLFDKVYADPCHPSKGTVPTGTSASDLVNVITSRPGLSTRPPVTYETLGGQQAHAFRLELAGVNLSNCTGGRYVLWELPLGATNELRPGMSERVWVVDTAAGRLVITAVTDSHTSPAAQSAIQQVLDSLQINP